MNNSEDLGLFFNSTLADATDDIKSVKSSINVCLEVTDRNEDEKYPSV